MGLKGLGEFDLIRKLQAILPEAGENVRIGIGDDAAQIALCGGKALLITTDTMVQNVHFDPVYTPMDSLGWKILAINLSDIAAMGGTPLAAVLSLAVPAGMKPGDLESLYQGVSRCSEKFNCPLVGGDTVRSTSGLVLTLTVTGEVNDGEQLTRGGANAGDIICVTGSMGKSRAGLEALQSGSSDSSISHPIRHFLEPRPKLEEIRKIQTQVNVSACIDISDGLSSELFHLCSSSDTGCLVCEEKIPVNASVRRWSEKNNRSLNDYLLNGGEEYELLLTVSSSQLPELLKIEEAGELFRIGTITDRSEGMSILTNGKKVPLQNQGWDHFQS